MNNKYNKRILQLVRATEKRLGKLPALIRKEFKAGSDRQLHALRKVEGAIESVARETKQQRELLELNVAPSTAPQIESEQ
jgi:hypothetical protein